MKALLLVCLLAFTGCATTSTMSETQKAVAFQRLLDKYISPGFTGDLDIQENLIYVSFTLKGANLRREESGWRYDWIEYVRNGPVGTSARITVGKRP
jgi:hypothetical protein